MPTRLKIRNWAAHSPLLKKGGAHVKSKSAQRASAKKAVKKAVKEWRDNLHSSL